MVRVGLRARELRDYVEADSINVERYVKEIAALSADLTKATGRMSKEEHLRMINMVTSIYTGGSGGAGGLKLDRGIMEHKVIQNMKAVSGDRGLFRQWHQKFTTAVGQVRSEYEEIAHKLARETVLAALGNEYKATLGEVCAVNEFKGWDNVRVQVDSRPGDPLVEWVFAICYSIVQIQIVDALARSPGRASCFRRKCHLARCFPGLARRGRWTCHRPFTWMTRRSRCLQRSRSSSCRKRHGSLAFPLRSAPRTVCG